MKLILKEVVQGLGRIGDVVDVSAGYGRNFLLPKRKAVEATPHNVRLMDQEKKVLEADFRRGVEEAQGLAGRIAALSITISRQVGEGEKMFGSVTSRDLALALEQEGFVVDKKQIQLDDPIKELGLFEVPVKLHQEVTGSIKLWVVKE